MVGRVPIRTTDIRDRLKADFSKHGHLLKSLDGLTELIMPWLGEKSGLEDKAGRLVILFLVDEFLSPYRNGKHAKDPIACELMTKDLSRRRKTIPRIWRRWKAWLAKAGAEADLDAGLDVAAALLCDRVSKAEPLVKEAYLRTILPACEELIAGCADQAGSVRSACAGKTLFSVLNVLGSAKAWSTFKQHSQSLKAQGVAVRSEKSERTEMNVRLRAIYMASLRRCQDIIYDSTTSWGNPFVEGLFAILDGDQINADMVPPPDKFLSYLKANRTVNAKFFGFAQLAARFQAQPGRQIICPYCDVVLEVPVWTRPNAAIDCCACRRQFHLPREKSPTPG